MIDSRIGLSRRRILILLSAAGGTAGSLAIAGGDGKARTTSRDRCASEQLADGGTVYTCPMHPEVISDKPGRCPKCGMKLVPKSNGTFGETGRSSWHPRHQNG